MIQWIKNVLAPYVLIKHYPCDRADFYTILEVGKGTRRFKFRGSGTVWHYFPEMRKCPTSLDLVLHQFGMIVEYESKGKKVKK